MCSNDAGMLRPVDHYFLSRDEPVRTCLQFLREYILRSNIHMAECWKYGMPFYDDHGKRICYHWVDKKSRQPYLGVVGGNKINVPALLQGKRRRMKIFPVDPDKDIPARKIKAIFGQVMKSSESNHR
jgi:hypothetical protein